MAFEIFDAVLEKQTLILIDVETILFDSFEHVFEISQMFLGQSASDDDVIQITHRSVQSC